MDESAGDEIAVLLGIIFRKDDTSSARRHFVPLDVGKMLRIGLGANSPVLVPSTMY
jgi:hypothetical protein